MLVATELAVNLFQGPDQGLENHVLIHRLGQAHSTVCAERDALERERSQLTGQLNDYEQRLEAAESRWSMDLPHQQRLRDVMGLEIGDGTAGIMKLIVARERVGRVAVQYAKR